MKRLALAVFPVLFFAVLFLFALSPHADAAEHQHSGIDLRNYTAWNSTNSLPTAPGNYYLVNNVKLPAAWHAPATGEDQYTAICLNGKTITADSSADSVIYIPEGAWLYLTDCSSSPGSITGGQRAAIVLEGSLGMYRIHIENTKSLFGGVLVQGTGDFSIYSGCICKNTAENFGGGIALLDYGDVHIYDGAQIYENIAPRGGGIYTTDNAAAVLNGGSIYNNVAQGSGGGGVYVDKSDTASLFWMLAGTLTGNSAGSSGYGGGVFVRGRAIIAGGEISGNMAAAGKGGGIYNIGSLEITGGSIRENEADEGGGVYSYKGITLSDCRIEDNLAYTEGGGLFQEMGDISVSGRVRIRGNENGSFGSSDYSNVWIDNTTLRFQVADALDGDSIIGVSLKTPPDATTSRTLTNGLKTNGGSGVSVGLFECDQRAYNVSWNQAKTEAIILKKPVITTYPQDVTVAEGAYASFTIKAEGLYISYQWEYSDDGGETWKEINGATGAKYTTTATLQKNGRLYHVLVGNPGYSFFTKTPAKLTVVSKPVITKQPKTLIVSLNATASFTLTASGTGLSYQWQYSTDDGKTWHDSTQTGAKTSSLSVEALSKRNGYQYRCNVKNAAGDTTSVAVQLLISGVKPVIRSQTNAITSAANVTVTFKVSAAGTGLSYQWQYSSDNGKTWHNSSMTGYNTAAMKVPVISGRNGYLYRCTVKNSYGSVTSSPAKLTVSGVKPVIRDQTKAITSSPNVTVTFKVAAAGVGLKYKWQYSNDGGKTWHDSTMTGYNTAAMKVPVTTARNGYQYRCIVSNSYGSVTSSPAKLTVK